MERTENEVHAILSELLLSAALPAGERLGERDLASTLGVSRERVRKVLLRLGAERLVTLIPNRGAFVATPSLESARCIYEARRVLEAGMMISLTRTITDAQIDELREHLQQEEDAARRGDRSMSVQLSGAFHLKLATLLGNEYICGYLQELVSRTSMLVAFYEAGAPSCGVHEHRDIVDAIARRDDAAAARLSDAHLSLIETRLRVQTGPQPGQRIDILETVRRRCEALDVESRATTTQPFERVNARQCCG